MIRSNDIGAAAVRLVLPLAAIVLVVGCTGSGGSPATQGTTAVEPSSQPTQAPAGEPSAPSVATVEPGASDDDVSAIGGDIGDPSKGSAQATVTGGVTASIDLPFGAPAAQFPAQAGGTAYLPFTDPVKGTLFITILDNQLSIQYAGPDNVALSNGGTPCELKVDALDAHQAKGSFTCKGMLMVHNESLGSADMTGTFEGHQ